MKCTDSFLEYLKAERNRSDKTVESYAYSLKEFQEFFEGLDEGLTWETVDDSVVREWVIKLLDDQHMSNASVGQRLSALRTFYHYLIMLGKVSKSPLAKVNNPKRKRPLPKFVREPEMQQLLDDVAQGDDFASVRNRLVILMLYMTGMRRNELLTLTDADIQYAQGIIKVNGKRNKQRLIPIGDELIALLHHYQTVREQTFGPQTHGGPLLLSSRGQALSVSTLYRIVTNNLSRVTNQQKRSPHVLRHTFATQMLNGGADLQSIQKLLGHESLQTTQVYTHLSFEQLKSEYQNAHPRSK